MPAPRLSRWASGQSPSLQACLDDPPSRRSLTGCPNTTRPAPIGWRSICARQLPRRPRTTRQVVERYNAAIAAGQGTTEIEIIREDEIKTVLQKRGRSMYPIAALGLATGMRRGELLASRWQDIDLDGKKLRVERSLEQTKAGLRFKAPKTKHGRRTVTINPAIIAELRSRWKEHQERRLALGAGRAPPDALVFPTWDFQVRSPNALTKEWSVAMVDAGLSVTLHSLRHSHASSLIAAGVDVLTISRRLGHASPVIILSIYGHLFSNTDDRAALVMESLFARVVHSE
jgi:integrase